MKRLLVATGNPGKVREFARALIPEGIEVLGLDSLKEAVAEPEETGLTFEANAMLKAEYYSLHTDKPALADDSGLEVDALDKAPGVKSARYGGPGLDDDGRNRAVLEAISDIADPARRSARFRCVLALAAAGRTIATFDGVVEGRLIEEPRGPNGFGYDPLFFHEPSGCTFGELDPAAKQAVSHRGQAIRALLEALHSGDSRLADLG
ncbi:MAG: RdgB/HAM1 family non-canonical purine NTP pyrophosphatase [bacterium]|nr:RdgB/HAM1 family non-canonical purine NTP pyrophosphatase [bacterium]